MSMPTKGITRNEASPRGKFVFRTRVGVVDRRAGDRYALCEVYAALPHGPVHPFLQASNVSNTGYQEIQGVPMPGRTIMGGVEWVVRKKKH